MPGILKYFIVLSCILCVGRNSSVHAKSVLYDESKGLSNNFVTQVIKDKTGLIWLGTRSGLNTFDGYSFREISQFKNYHINNLLFDSASNQLWIGSTEGLFLMNLDTKQIIDCTIKLRKKNVTDLGMYQKRVIVVFSDGKILGIESNFSSKIIFTLPQHLFVRGNGFRHIAFDKAGYLYALLVKKKGLFILNLNTGAWSTENTFNDDGIESLHTGNGHCLINLTTKKLVFYTASNNTPRYHFIPLPNDVLPGSIVRINERKNEIYFTGTESYRGYSLDFSKTHFEQCVAKVDELFQSWSINAVFHDSPNITWIGTNKGLIKIYFHDTFSFKKLFDNEGSAISIRQIIDGNRDNLYIATYDGIYEYNKSKKKAVLLTQKVYPDMFPLYSRVLYYDNKGYVFAGTESNSYYFYRYNTKQKKFESNFFHLKSEGIELSSVYSIYPGNRNLLWLGTDKGLASYNRKTDTLQLHISDNFNTGTGKIMHICRDANPDQFWVVSKSNAFLINETTGKQLEFTKNFLPILPDDEFIFAGTSPQNELWLGTLKSGIIIVSKDRKNARILNKSNGLPSNTVYAVLWQDSATAWISTSNGLSKYNFPLNSFYNFFRENGLTDNEFNQISFLKSKDGQLYFGGIDGINYFNPRSIKPPSNKPLIISSNISKWNTGELINIKNAPDITMLPNDHLLTFSFGLSDYSEPENHYFFYRISEPGHDWIPLGNSNVLRIEGLPAGKHIIEIIGFNKHGEQSSNSLKYRVYIKQVFYKTIWFYIIIIVVIILIAYGMFKWTVQNIHERQRLRTQIASNLHDEVGSLLTSIIISTDSARYASNTIDDKNKKLEKISSLSRSATNIMSDVLWSIDARNDYAGNLTDRMREHAEGMLDPLGIDIEFNFSPNLQGKNIESGIRQQLYLIFKEAINNIIKHSKASLIKVYYDQNGTGFILTIQNNNHLLLSDKPKHMGQGLQNMQMRARNIKALCTFETTGDSYTVVIKSTKT